MVYYRSADATKVFHMCFAHISDVLKHDHLLVYVILADLISRLKRLLPNELSTVHYFTDGCSAQYKFYKSCSNIMYHKEDFDVDVKWHFFATLHGKSACDGIGATIKYQARRASLQKPNH